MSWFKNLFKRKPKKRLLARDHIGRFISDEKGNALYTDSPKEEIEKAIARAKKRDAELQKSLLKTTKKNCGCDADGICNCSTKKTTAKKPAAKTTKPAPKKK